MTAYSRPEVRAVLDDAALEAGRAPAWGPWVRWAQRHANADDAAATTAADAAADAADDDADADAAAADADDDADADAAAAYADDAADDDADADAANDAVKNSNRYWRGAEMREGMVLVQVPGRYWGVTRVGWAQRIEGDEWRLVGACTVVRQSGPGVPLDVLASQGPGKNHSTTEPAQAAELLHRWSPRRVLEADEAAWTRYVGPKP